VGSLICDNLSTISRADGRTFESSCRHCSTTSAVACGHSSGTLSSHSIQSQTLLSPPTLLSAAQRNTSNPRLYQCLCVSDKPCQTWAGKVQRLKSQAAHDAPMHRQCATYESNLSGTAQYLMQLFKHLCMQAGMHNRSSCKCQGESPISCAHTYRQHMYKEGVPKRSELSAIGCFSSTDFPQHHTIAVDVHFFSAR